MVQNDQQTLKPPYLEKLGEQDGLVILRVDGAYIRSKLDVEFTNFANITATRLFPSMSSGSMAKRPTTSAVSLSSICWSNTK